MLDVAKTKMRFQELSELCFKIDLVTANMRYHVRLFFSKETFQRLYFSRPLQSISYGPYEKHNGISNENVTK